MSSRRLCGRTATGPSSAWLDRQHIGTLYSTTVTLAELRLGLAISPAGKRCGGLQTKLDERVSLFAGDRILRFDVPAAENYATITARARETGTAVRGG
jgi:predicted nucleic acid-binding protein